MDGERENGGTEERERDLDDPLAVMFVFARQESASAGEFTIGGRSTFADHFVLL